MVVSATLTPDADIRFGGDPLTKIQNPEVLKYLLDDGLVHQIDPIGIGRLQSLQRRKYARQGPHRFPVAFRRLAQRDCAL